VADEPGDATTDLEAQLRQLRALARSGLPGDDHDLVVTQHLEQLVPSLGDRERGGVGDRGHEGSPPFELVVV